MKRMFAFSKRNAKEILRDGVTLFFGIAFPLILLLLMTAIQANIPVEIYNIERLAPGVAAFGLCFLSLYIAIGLLCGSLMNDKQVGGICGALLTNVSGWLSGVWFDLALVGGAFEKIACALPFVHAADAARAAIAGDYAAIPTHIAVVLAYAVVIYILAVVVFRKKMKM